MPLALSTNAVPQDVLEMRAWDWAARQLDVHDAGELITRVQDVVARAAHARQAQPDHTAWPRPADVPMQDGSPREQLLQIDQLQDLPEWRQPGHQARLDAARQEVLCALAIAEGWPNQVVDAQTGRTPTEMPASTAPTPAVVPGEPARPPSRSGPRRIEPPAPSWRRHLARRVGRKALQLSSRLLRGPSLT